MPASRIADFKKPPVAETAFAVEFAAIPGWTLAHFGSLWESFRAEYPLATVEPFWAATSVEPTDPPVRFLFKSSDETELLQLRTNAFVRNWKASGSSSYPRYETTRPSFARDLQTFYAYLDDHKLSRPSVFKCELTYINHLIQGRDWTDIADVFAAVPTLAPQGISSKFASLTRFQTAINHELPENAGGLWVQIMPGINHEGTQLYQLSLTAYGQPQSNEIEDLLSWMDMAHQHIVLGFLELTSKGLQEKWERIC